MDEDFSIEENWQRLIRQSFLMDTDFDYLMAFLNSIYRRCLSKCKLPHKLTDIPPSEVSTSWVSDRSITALAHMLKMLFEVRRLARDISKPDYLDRLRVCPRWQAVPHFWTERETIFMLQVIATTGFTSFIEYFTGNGSPIAHSIRGFNLIRPDLLRLREQERMQLEIMYHPRLSDYRFLADIESCMRYVTLLTKWFKSISLERVIRSMEGNVFALVEPGTMCNGVPFGYFAFRVLNGELFSCGVGGSPVNPCFSIVAFDANFKGPTADAAFTALRQHRGPVLRQFDITNGRSFFGLDQGVVKAIHSRMVSHV